MLHWRRGPGEPRHARKNRWAGEERSKKSGLRGGASSLVSFPGGREGKFINCWRLTWTLPTGIASSRLSLPSHTVMTRSVWRLERRTGNTNALPFPFDGHAGLALLYTIPVTACMDMKGSGVSGTRISTLKSERPCFAACRRQSHSVNIKMKTWDRQNCPALMRLDTDRARAANSIGGVQHTEKVAELPVSHV